jgi:hypothetical protein
MPMRSWATVALAMLLVACTACKKQDRTGSGPGDSVPPQAGVPSGAPSPGAAPPGAKSGTPFLQGAKDVPARKEWNRDFGSAKGGVVVFRASSTVPFAVTIITDKGYQALTSRGKPDRSDLLLTVDAKPPSYEGRITVPPGRAWFIIENQSDATAQIRLECYEGN